MDYKKIGSFLRKEREQKGLSFHQVYEITKIQPNILRSIELGEPKISEIFYTNFIKTYVKFLGLEWKQVVKEGLDKKLVKPKEKEELKKKKEFSFQWKGFVFIGIALILLFLLFALISSKKNSKEGEETPFNEELDLNISQDGESLETEENFEMEEELRNEQESATEEEARDEKESATEGDRDEKEPATKEDRSEKKSAIEEDRAEKESATEKETPTQQKMFGKVQQGNFEQELMIKSLESIKIYFKLDKKAIVAKDLKPRVWFVIKAKESIYIRFDEQVDQVEMFYNGVKWNFKSSRFFENTFTKESNL